MKNVLSFIAIFVIALCVKAQTPATLPYSCDFSDDYENSNWVFKNTGVSMTAGWDIWNMGSNPFLICGIGQDDYMTDFQPATVLAERSFHLGYSDEINLSFYLKVGGEGTTSNSYDYLTVFVMPTTVDWEASTDLGSFLGSSSDYDLPYAVCFGEKTIENVKLHNRDEIMQATVSDLSPNTDYKIVFVWRNDDDGGDGYAVQIDNLTIEATIYL